MLRGFRAAGVQARSLLVSLTTVLAVLAVLGAGVPDTVNAIAAWTPTGLLIGAIRGPWAGCGLYGPAMLTLATIGAVAYAVSARRLARI